ncbi:MAG: 23S rRNA (adenine(2030)-N(6))-methyltransferase RlmJ [Pseudomonadota bacterium]
MKHVALVMVISHLGQKDKPFRVIDTHAGRGVYTLDDNEASRTEEADGGIKRLLHADRTMRGGASVHPAIETYLAVCKQALDRSNASSSLVTHYPGSPLIARALLREQDRLHVNELHPEEGRLLSHLFSRDRHAAVTKRDGWEILKAVLPPKERRGLVLIDPPFEKTNEFDVIATALGTSLKRFETGQYLIWYPLKSRKRVDRFYAAIADMTSRETVAFEFVRGPVVADGGLAACGLLVCNPPYQFEENYRAALQSLSAPLGETPDRPAKVIVRRLVSAG